MNRVDREIEWSNGFHTSSTGEQTRLENLPTAYLRNIIAKYSHDHNVSALDTEMLKREADTD